MAAIRCLSPLLSCSSRLACRSAVRLPVPFARFSSAGRALFQARPSTLIANSKLTLAVPAGLIAWAKLKTPLTVLRCNAAIEEAVDSNDAVELSITNQGPSSTDLLVELGKALQPDALLLLLTAATAVATAVVSLATPSATGELVNVLAKLAQAPNDGVAAKTFSELISGLSNNTALNVAAAKLFSLFLLNSWLTFAYVAMVSQVGENLAERLRGRLFSSIVRQDISFFDERKSGDLLNRLTADVQNFKSSIKSTISQGLKAVTQTIGGLVSLYLLSPPLTIFLLTTLPCLYSIGSLYGRYLRHLSETARQSDALSSSIANECLSNIRTVRAFAMEDEESETYQDALNEASYLHKLLGLHIGLFQGLNTLALSGMFLSVLYFGGYLVYRGDMTAGQLMTYLISTQTTQRALATLVVLYGSVTKALGAGSRVFEYMSRKPLVPVKGGIILSQINGDIQFHNIRFAYPSRPDRLVLDNFNFTIQQGQIVALCGLSGGGKSTIAALLERFYEPLSGTITLDGHALSSLDPSWLRSQIGYISQEPVLFGTSIYNNIRYGRPDATLEEVQEAAKQANAHEFISGFTDGYHTLVGERGVALSGGQRQRIAIARALIKNPKVLILDEATSALDAESEKLVQEALDRVMKGRTVLVIAHRLSTIKEASVICVLGKHFGNIIEKGTHSELLSKGGVYAGLYQQLQSQK